jgi:hypothetical protein
MPPERKVSFMAIRLLVGHFLPSLPVAGGLAIAAILASVWVAAIFAMFHLDHRDLLTSFLMAGMILIGLVLLFVVSLDALNRLAAKWRLAEVLSKASDSELEFFKLRLEPYMDIAQFDPYDKFHYGPRGADWGADSFRQLIVFLNSEPYGRLASQALLQRSPVGRRRYFAQAVRLSRQWR